MIIHSLSRFIASTHNSWYANGLSPVRTIPDMPIVYLGLLPVCFSEWRVRHYWCGADFRREFTLVRLYMNVKQVKDSENRCGVFIGFCLKPTHIQGSYNSLSSVFRLLLIEAITLPFHRQKSKYSLSISLSPRSIFCNNRLLRNFLLSPSTLYGPTL